MQHCNLYYIKFNGQLLKVKQTLMCTQQRSMMNQTDLIKQNVSRETFLRLEKFERILLKWNQSINLIAKEDEPCVWERHMMDSLQLLELLPQSPSQIVDFGSGAGFPGVVLAIASNHHFTLVEKNYKRASFLRYVSRETKTSYEVFDNLLEKYEKPTDVITARAVMELDRLWSICAPKLPVGGYGLFLKGSSYTEELKRFQCTEQVTIQLIPSLTNPKGAIIKIIKR
jgi:16S rRNA (guanine527-N7)-methyltransferase